jgi:hypothetical protein
VLAPQTIASISRHHASPLALPPHYRHSLAHPQHWLVLRMLMRTMKMKKMRTMKKMTKRQVKKKKEKR